MAMTRDIMNLIRNITQNKIDSLEENSKIMNLSERSLRYKIDDCNYHLKSLKLPEMRIKKGIISFESTLDEVMEKINKNIYMYSFSQDEREKIILNFYLFKKEPATIEDMSEFLGVSSVTLKNDVKRIKKYLKTFMLSLTTENNKCLTIKGDERNIRKLILDILLKNYDITFKNEDILVTKTYYHGFFISWKEMDEFLNRELINESYQLLKKILRNNKKNISDEAFKVLFFYILIMLNRYPENKIVTIKNMNFLSNTPEYLLVKEFFNEYKMTEGEIFTLTEYFLGSNTFNFDHSFYGNWVQIETSIMQLIKEMGKHGYSGLDKDETLIEGLINHIKPAIYRSKTGIQLSSDFYDEFKENYPLILSQVEDAWEKCNFQDFHLSNEEMAYIGIHFQLAIKRIKKRVFKDILIVCGSGYSTSKFLAESIQERFSVNIVDTIPYNMLENYKNVENIDLIITTINNLENTFFPVVTVSPILSSEDIKKLESLHLSQSKNKIKISKLLEITRKNTTSLDEEEFIKEIKKYFKNEIIDDVVKTKLLKFTDMISMSRIEKIKGVKTWQEAVKLSGKKLITEGFVEESYMEEIIELINKFGSYMVIQEGIILTHARGNKSINKTGIGILYLEEPVEFPENEKVQLLITLASKDKREHLNGLMDFVNILREVKLLEQLKNCQTISEIYITFKNLFN